MDSHSALQLGCLDQITIDSICRILYFPRQIANWFSIEEMVAAEEDPLTSDAIAKNLLQLHRPLTVEEAEQLVLYLNAMHATLDTSNAFSPGEGNLALSCEVLSRIRNSSISRAQALVLQKTCASAVLAVLKRHGDASVETLAQSVCLLFNLCWCGVDQTNTTGHGHQQRCLALEDDTFAPWIADQCAELTCEVLLQQHTRYQITPKHPNHAPRVYIVFLGV